MAKEPLAITIDPDNRAGRSRANRAGRTTIYQDAFDRLERR